MTWTNPPTAVTEMRTMLLASSSFTGAGFASGNVHYPAAALDSVNSSTADTLPVCVLAEEAQERTRYAEGARGLPTGTIAIVLYVDTDTGTLEALARSILDDLLLLGQSQGLPIRSGSVGLCSDATSAQLAADETDTQAKHRSITITVDYGLTA